MSNPYIPGVKFARLFQRMEYALKRSGYLKTGRADAQADWEKFARSLGERFFDMIASKGIAPTLIGAPPRKLMKDGDGLQWSPETPRSVKTVVELMVQGVCRVRNSYFHGEKFIGGPDATQWTRDVQLVEEAFAVLKEADACLKSASSTTVQRALPDVLA